MSEWKKVKIGDFLEQYRNTIYIDDSVEYGQITISSKDGVKYRCSKMGKEIGRKRQFVIDLKTHPNTVIFTRQGIADGSIGIAPLEVDGCIATENMPMFSVNEDYILIDYLRYLLISPIFRNLIATITPSGSAQKAIHERELLALEISIPDLQTQQEIVKKISLQLQKAEQVSVEIEAQKNYIKQLRQTILQDAIEGKLTADWRKQNPAQKGNPDYDAEALFEQIQKGRNGEKKQKELSPITDEEKPFEIPEGWKWVRLGEISDIVRGGSPRPAGDKTYYDGNIPFLKVADITNSDEKELWTYTYTIKEAGLKKTRFVDKETLMLTNSGATLGIPKICMIATTFNDGIAAFLDIKNRITKDYLFYYLKSKTQWFLKEAAKGQGQPNLNTDIISATVLALPPLAEQEEIVNKIETLLAKVTELETQIQERKTLSDKLIFGIIKENLEG